MFFKKRAQAAMEFLMTYGWAILVVLAAVGILAYLGVFNMQEKVPSVCELNPTGQGLDCKTDPYFDATNDQVTFTVVNSNPWNASSISFGTGVDNTCVTGLSAPSSMDRGTTAVVNATGCTITTGETYNEKFTITYNDENGQPHKVTAHISGTA